MGLGIFSDFTAGGDVALYTLHPALKAVLNQAVLVFLDAPAMYFIAPAFIWLAVTFRRSDWVRVFGKAE
jgi:hypothetical protein